MAKTQVNFRIEPDLLEAVKDKAKEEKLESYTQWIIDAIKMRLGELPPSSTSLDDRIAEAIDQRLEKLQEGDSEELDNRIFLLEESNKKLIIAFQSAQANFHAEISNLSAKLESLENNPSQDSQEGVITTIQVSEAITGETEPSRGIDAEKLLGKGIEAKELKDILDIPQSTLSDWVKRRGEGKGKPSRGSHKDKWSEFMMWEKHEGKWYRNNL
jgi:hypothetical protein